MRIVIQFLAGSHRWHGRDVVVSLVRRRNRIGLRRHQPYRRVVDALLVAVLIALNRAFRRLAAALFPSRHLLFTSLPFTEFVGMPNFTLRDYRKPVTDIVLIRFLDGKGTVAYQFFLIQ